MSVPPESNPDLSFRSFHFLDEQGGTEAAIRMKMTHYWLKNIPIDPEFLKTLEDTYDLELDEKGCIICYKRKSSESESANQSQQQNPKVEPEPPRQNSTIMEEMTKMMQGIMDKAAEQMRQEMTRMMEKVSENLVFMDKKITENSKKQAELSKNLAESIKNEISQALKKQNDLETGDDSRIVKFEKRKRSSEAADCDILIVKKPKLEEDSQ